MFQKGDLVRMKKEHTGLSYSRNCAGVVLVSDVKCELWKDHKHTRVYWMGVFPGSYMPDMVPTNYMEKVSG